jgi:hypothetical protein
VWHDGYFISRDKVLFRKDVFTLEISSREALLQIIEEELLVPGGREHLFHRLAFKVTFNVFLLANRRNFALRSISSALESSQKHACWANERGSESAKLFKYYAARVNHSITLALAENKTN